MVSDKTLISSFFLFFSSNINLLFEEAYSSIFSKCIMNILEFLSYFLTPAFLRKMLYKFIPLHLSINKIIIITTLWSRWISFILLYQYIEIMVRRGKQQISESRAVENCFLLSLLFELQKLNFSNGSEYTRSNKLTNS